MVSIPNGEIKADLKLLVKRLGGGFTSGRVNTKN